MAGPATQLSFDDSLAIGLLAKSSPAFRAALERSRAFEEGRSSVADEMDVPSAAAQREGRALEGALAKEPTPGALVPLLPEKFRALPHVALRSALFGVIQTGERSVQKNQLVATTAGIEIRFSGERLDQADLDVWEEVVHRARGVGNPKGVYFGIREFLRAVGRRGCGGSDKAWLWECFRRLKQAQVSIAVIDDRGRRRAAFMGSLLGSNVLEADGRYFVELNPEVTSLFGQGRWSKVDHTQRMKLGRDHLAKWLHGYFASHLNPYPTKVSTLMALSGSAGATLRNFRGKVRKALQKLQAVGALEAWTMDSADLVRVRKSQVPRPR